MRHPRSLALLFMLAGSLAPAASTRNFPARLHQQVGDVTIEFSIGDEAYATALTHSLESSVPKSHVAGAASPLTLAKMRESRQVWLDHIARDLNLTAPTAKMAETFDQMLSLFAALPDPHTAPLKHYVLWRRPELLARLQAGQKINGFTLGGDTGIEFGFSFSYQAQKAESLSELGRRVTESWNSFEAPLSIGGADNANPVQEIEQELATLRKRLSQFLEFSTGHFGPFVVLHETTEIAIIDRYLNSRDRRWFCDGMANYVAWKTLRDVVGREEADRAYDLAAELQKFAPEAAHVDLERWPAAENLSQTHYAESLNTANYAFATKVIADLCAAHGEAVLPRWFAEIGKTPHDTTTMKNVHRAFKKVTGKELRTYLPGRSRNKPR